MSKFEVAVEQNDNRQIHNSPRLERTSTGSRNKGLAELGGGGVYRFHGPPATFISELEAGYVCGGGDGCMFAWGSRGEFQVATLWPSSAVGLLLYGPVSGGE